MPPSPLPAGGDFREWHRWCKLLPKVRRYTAVHDPKGRFTFYATRRNPLGPGRHGLELREGVHGLREPRLLTIYKETLERAYDFFTKQGRPEPVRDKDGRVPVYVFAVDDSDMDCGSPCEDELLFLKPPGVPDRIVPVLALPSRSARPDSRAAEAKARAAAVHELSHLFNARFLPYRRLGANGLELLPATWIRSWLWLDEGTAVATEAEAVEEKVIPKSDDWLVFALDWVDRPERALDDPDGWYQAAFFVRYVKRLMTEKKQADFLNRVWQMSATVWDPLTVNGQSRRFAAVTALTAAFGQLPQPLEFCSADKTDVFASGYCFDSYFLNDKNLPSHEPEVIKRFKERAVTRTWPFSQNNPSPSNPLEVYPLSGLACRYFRFIPGDVSGNLTVRVVAHAGHKLKAELALAAHRTKYYVPKSRQLGVRHNEGDSHALVCELPNFSRKACDHAVLVVTNCDFASEQPDQLPPFGYTQRAEFRVETRVS